MIKLASLVFIPALAATFYAHQEPSQPLTVDLREVGAEAEDRQFLNALENPDSAVAQPSPADRAFLAGLQAEEAQQQRAAAEEARIPVRRALPIERPTPDESQATAIARAMTPAATDSSNDASEVRRAIPGAKTTSTVRDPRAALEQSYVTLIEPEPAGSIAATSPRRGSITILGDQVIVRQTARAQSASDPR